MEQANNPVARPPWNLEPITRPATCRGCRKRFKVWGLDPEGDYARVYRDPDTKKWVRFHDECWPDESPTETDEDSGADIAGEVLVLLDRLIECDDARNTLGWLHDEVQSRIADLPSSKDSDEQPTPKIKPKPRRLRAVG